MPPGEAEASMMPGCRATVTVRSRIAVVGCSTFTRWASKYSTLISEAFAQRTFTPYA
jgi:hypothetical protein